MKSLIILVFVILALFGGICTVTSASVVTQDFTYQGVLSDPGGDPLTGTYDVSFNLYDIVETTPPWTMQRFLANDNVSVQCTNGKFTTKLTFDASYFDGRPLFLGIAVGTDPEMTPRQQITSVPYALGLRPGASIILNDNASNLNLINTGGGSALNISSTGSNASGIFEYVNGTNSAGLKIVTNGPSCLGLGVMTLSNYSNAVRLGTKGLYSHALELETHNDYSLGVLVNAYGNGSSGMEVFTGPEGGNGILTSNLGDNCSGIHTETVGQNSPGISIITCGDNSPGLLSYSSSPYSPAVKGESMLNTGVYGVGKEGGRFEATGTGNTAVNVTVPGLYGTGIDVKMGDAASTGINITTRESSCRAINTNLGYGSSVGSFVTAIGDAQTGMAVRLQDGTGGIAYSANTVGERQKGIVVTTNGYYADGMDITTNGPASQGITVTTHNGSSPAIKITTDGGYSSPAIEASVIGGNAIVADTGSSDGAWAFYTNDGVRAGWFHSAGTGDVAEYMDATEDLPPGTVLIIGGDGRLTQSTAAYDTRVAGIISTNPGMKLGGDDGMNEGKELIAVAGRVPCKVDASYGAIHPGDLLATSDTPGYAMKAQPVSIGGIQIYRSGTVLGKAMGTLESGTGSIDVIVTLQ